MGGKELQRLAGAADHIVVAQGCLALGPAFNAFKQGAALVPARLPGGHGSVEMDVWLHERGCDQIFSGIQFAFIDGGIFGLGGDT